MRPIVDEASGVDQSQIHPYPIIVPLHYSTTHLSVQYFRLDETTLFSVRSWHGTFILSLTSSIPQLTRTMAPLALLRRNFITLSHSHLRFARPFSHGNTTTDTTSKRRIDKILVANRGEIACRITRTARRLGIQTIAVYSDADRDSLHVASADHAVRIGPPPPRLSYLNGASIVDAAVRSGAQVNDSSNFSPSSFAFLVFD